MAKILVTGSAGFIGMHTVLWLKSAGHDVVGLDNINQYYDPALKYGRLAEQGIEASSIIDGVLTGNGGLQFIKLSLEDAEGINSLFESQRFDYVIHLAAQAGVRYSLDNPSAYVSSNIDGFLNILEACRNYPVKHLVYASSSSVYGLNDKVPFEESHATEHPVSLYAASKKANEMMAHSYASLYNIPLTGLRFFTVYGPWGRPDMALFKFTKNILEEKAIDVYNNGEMYRDFTYVSDIVEGVCRLMELPPEVNREAKNLATNESPASYAIYNIGNSKPIKLTDFVIALEEALGKKAIINYMPMQPGDVHTTYASVERLSAKTGYKPTVNVKQGIDAFVAWYKDFYKLLV